MPAEYTLASTPPPAVLPSQMAFQASRQMLKTRLGIGYGWNPEQTALATAQMANTKGGLATARMGNTKEVAFGATAGRQDRVVSPAMDEAAVATRGL